MGIPMLALAWPAAWMLLLPVVLLEGAVAVRTVGVGWAKALHISGRANFVSTLVGIPLAWVAMLIPFYLVALIDYAHPDQISSALVAPFYAAWLPPDVHPWWVPAAGAVLCVPFFLASTWIESFVSRRGNPELPPQALKAWAIRANGISYAAIGIALVVTAVVVGRE